MAVNKNNSIHLNGSADDRALGVDTREKEQHINTREGGIEHFGALELDEQVNEIKAQRGTPGKTEEGDEDYDDEETQNVDLEEDDLDVEEDDELEEEDLDDAELDDDAPDEKDSYTDYNGNSDSNRPVR
jgi:hypothetical protein